MKTNCVPQIPLTGGWFPVNSRKRRRRSGAKKPLKSRAGTELSLARVSLQQPLRALCLGENANTRLPRSTLRLLISVTTSRFSLNLDLAKKKKNYPFTIEESQISTRFFRSNRIEPRYLFDELARVESLCQG